MNYRPDAIDLLAAEYVIGTLHGSARRRFDRLLSQRADVRQATWDWEQRLHGLYADIEPVRPPRSLWRSVRRRIGGDDRSARLRPRFAMAFATAAVFAFAFWLGGIIQDEPVPGEAEYLAVFADDDARALWVINVDADTGQLTAETPGVAPLDAGLVHELWALPAGEDPLSLGLLSVEAGRLERTLTPELVAAVGQSANFAISLEPAGGSPTGLPTGPIVYQASLVDL